MKKRIAALALAVACVAGVTACGGSKDSPTQAPASTQQAQSNNNDTPATKTETPTQAPAAPRKISVEIYDRNVDGGTDVTNNYYTDYVKAQMLAKHNVEVSYQAVGRWSETTDINNLLAAGTAPGICVTYDAPTIQLYADMGGIVDLAPYLEKMKGELTNLWGRLGDNGIYWDINPDTGALYSIEGKRANTAKSTTFVRSDWLEKLGLAVPTSLDEFHSVLVAFRDNAQTLLGDEASQMIPMMVTYDAGWTGEMLINAFLPDKLTEKDLWVRGFDSRRIMFPETKEAMRVLNAWYYEGLLWKDFALYGSGDQTGANLDKAGYVGAQINNWDVLFRGGDDSNVANIRRSTGNDNAGYISITPFPNDAGIIRTFPYAPVGSDRKVFMPVTNKEVEASLLYLDFLATTETLKFLQLGDEGVTHTVEANGGYKTVATTGEKMMNSLNNIDYTIIVNGLDFADAQTVAKSIALGYAGIDPDVVVNAYETSIVNGRISSVRGMGVIESEAGVGTALDEKRDKVYDQAIVATPDKFDSVYDSGVADYMATGGQAIIDERNAVWEKRFGSGTEFK